MSNCSKVFGSEHSPFISFAISEALPGPLVLGIDIEVSFDTNSRSLLTLILGLF